MVFKVLNGVLVTLLIAITCLKHCKASYSVGGNSYSIGNAINLRTEPQSCLDFIGRTIKHDSHYVPAGVDKQCAMCKCDDGKPKSCRNILCQPPSGCRSFQMTSSCCEFVCLDKKDHEKSSYSTRQVITLILLCILILVIILCCICRFQQMKKMVEKRFEKMKAKRDEAMKVKREEELKLKRDEEALNVAQEAQNIAQEAQNVPHEAPTTVSFIGDIYGKIPADVKNKNDEVISSLKRQISCLEDHLASGETSEQILKKNEDSWKNLYDLHVDIKDSTN